MGATASVLGASGYSGGELVRLLAGHPAFGLGPLGAHSAAGARLADVHPHLAPLGDVALVPQRAAARAPADVVFSCLPHGALGDLVDEIQAPVIVDLADDFRAGGPDGRWVYGLTEFAREALDGATRIANPGCYPTATLLALLPFARAGLVRGPFVVDALSGASGAGRGLEDRLLFASLDASATAYGTVGHRHVPEIERALNECSGDEVRVSFTPHLVPMARGVVVTCRAVLTKDLSDAEAVEVLRSSYDAEPFVDVTNAWPSTKPVTGTNRALVSARVDPRTQMLICSAAIDNLGKGAAGQAIQNANIALGIDETTGLEGLGVWP